MQAFISDCHDSGCYLLYTIHMNRRKSRRARQIQLALTYIVMVGMIVVIVTLLAFFVNGYRYNSTNGKFVQGGLVQLDSTPSGAAVTIDNKPFGSNTSAHTTLFSGLHTFTIEKQGYDTWKNTVRVAPGSVVWLTYPRLIPTTLSPKVVQKYATVTSAESSSDGKYMAFDTPGTKARLALVDISGDNVVTTSLSVADNKLAVPADAKGTQFTIIGWSGDNHYLLVQHTYDKNKTEWLRIDTTGSHDVRNITSELGLDFAKVQFRPNSSSAFYGLTNNGDLRRFDLSSDTISAPLATNVENYTINDDKTLTYVSTYDKQSRIRSVGYISDGASHGQILRSYTDDGKKPLHIATDTYYGTRYFAISYGSRLEIIEANVPNSDDTNGTSKLQLFRSFTLPFNDAEHLAFRTSGRFIVASDRGSASVYDMGLDNFTTMNLGNTSRPLQWLDGYIAWSTVGGELTIADFDGANRHDIMPAINGLDATLSPNGKYLYAFTKMKSGEVALSRVQLLLQ